MTSHVVYANDREVVDGEKMSTFNPCVKLVAARPRNVTVPTEPTKVVPVLPMKRADVQKRLQIGATLLRELNNPKHRNYDPDFPKPFRLTDNGPDYFDSSEIDRWLQKRRGKYLSCEEAVH